MRPGLLLALLGSLTLAAPARAAELELYVFDVGQGDAMLLLSPAGKAVLIDAGPPEAGPALKARLEALLPGPLDLAVLTHAHLDHLGGMEQALEARGAKRFWEPAYEHPSPALDQLTAQLEEKQIPVEQVAAGRTLDLGGGAKLEVLAPPAPPLKGTKSDANANAVVLRITYGERKLLLAADAEPESESGLLARGQDVSADVLKVAHHGDRRSSTENFVRAVRPRVAIISVGAGNGYDEPSGTVLDRLQDEGARVYRTDLDGELHLSTNGDRLTVRAANEAAPEAEPVAQPEPPAQPAPQHPPGKVIKVAQPPERPAQPQGTRFAASKRANVFHRADCRAVKQIKPDNLQTFPTREAALASGRQPARDCSP